MITDRLYRSLRRAPAFQRQFRRIVRRLPHRKRVVEHFGQSLMVDPSELHGFYLYYEQEYDDYIFDFLSARLSQYKQAIDLGANVGIYTTFLASHLERVNAFEPDSANLGRLRSNLERNHCRNVTVHAACIGKERGTVSFLHGNAANQGLGKIVDCDDGQTEKVPSLSLDDFFGGPANTPTLIKMDIEGGEWLALQGCSTSVGKRTARVDMLIEIHPDDIAALGGTVGQLYTMLADLGLSARGLTHEGLVPLDEKNPLRFVWASGEPISRRN